VTRKRKILLGILLTPLLVFVAMLVVTFWPVSNTADLTGPVELTDYEDWKAILDQGITKANVLEVLRMAEENFARFQVETTYTRTVIVDGKYSEPSRPSAGSFTFVRATAPQYQAAHSRYTVEAFTNRVLMFKQALAFNGEATIDMEFDTPAIDAGPQLPRGATVVRSSRAGRLSRALGMLPSVRAIQPAYGERFGRDMYPMGLFEFLRTSENWRVLESSNTEQLELEYGMPNMSPQRQDIVFHTLLRIDLTRGGNIVAKELWSTYETEQPALMDSREDVILRRVNGVWVTQSFKHVSWGYDPAAETQEPLQFTTHTYRWLNVNGPMTPADVQIAIPPGLRVREQPYIELIAEDALRKAESILKRVF
jgi:hypothetical protein